MLSRIAPARLLAATIGGLLIFTTAAAVGVPATAVTNVTISGTVIDSGGAPVGGVRVWAEGSPSSATTSAQGQFSFPVYDGSTTRLSLSTPMSETGQGASLAMTTQQFTVAGDLDIGTATLPPLVSKAVRVVDMNGTPVYRAGLHVNGGAVPGWLDAGHQLTPQLQVANAGYSISAGTNEAGEVTAQFPRLSNDKLPPVQVSMATGTGSVYTANLADAVGANPHVVTISGYTVGPPTVPTPMATTSNMKSGEAYVYWMSSQVWTNGSPITGYTITATPGGATMQAPADAGSVTMQGLTNGVSHTFVVTAHSAAGSTTSTPTNAVVPAGPPLATPDLKAVFTGSVAPGAKYVSGQITATWGAADGSGAPITGYQIETNVSAERELPAEQRSMVFEGLYVTGETIHVSIRALNAKGQGPPAVVSVTIPGAPATPPGATPIVKVPGTASKPTARAKGSKVIVKWLAPNAASGGPVARYLVTATRVGSTTTGKRKTTAERRFVFKNLKPGKYKFAVTAMNAAGPGRTSPSVRVVIARRP